MPTNKQRREAQRRHLERQLDRRREQELRGRKTTLILSIAGTLVLIAAVVVAVVLIGNGGHSSSASAPQSSSDAKSPNQAASTASSPSAPASSSYPAATGPSVSFDGVTVTGAADLSGYPVVTSKSSTSATKLMVKDLVVGKGQPANPTSTVTVQYDGLLYSNGSQFDSSWKHGQPATFSLAPGHVIAGFTQGIGGTTGVAPMKVGGRRIIIMPAALGYQNQAQPGIPANSTLVFIVDLKSVGATS